MRLTHCPSKFEFYTAILTSCDNHTAVLNTVPVLLRNFEYFKSQIDAIKKEKNEQEEKLISLASERCKSKEKLCYAAADIMMLIQWGDAYEESMRSIFVNELFARDGRIFHKKLLAAHRMGCNNIEKLKKFGITAPLLDEFLNMISFYFSNDAAKKREEAERMANKKFSDLYRKAEAILKAMDKNIQKLKADYPYFFASYTESRRHLYEMQAA